MNEGSAVLATLVLGASALLWLLRRAAGSDSDSDSAVVHKLLPSSSPPSSTAPSSLSTAFPSPSETASAGGASSPTMAATLAERTLGRPVLRTTIDVDLPRLARKSTIYYYSGSGAEGKKAKHEQEQEQEQGRSLAAAVLDGGDLVLAKGLLARPRALESGDGIPSEDDDERLVGVRVWWGLSLGAGGAGDDNGQARALGDGESAPFGRVVCEDERDAEREGVYEGLRRDLGEPASFLVALCDCWAAFPPASEESFLAPSPDGDTSSATPSPADVISHFQAAAAAKVEGSHSVREFLEKYCTDAGSGEDVFPLGAPVLLKVCSNQGVLAPAAFQLKQHFRKHGIEFKDLRGTWRVGVAVELDDEGRRRGFKVFHRKWEQDRDGPRDAVADSATGAILDRPRFVLRWQLEFFLDPSGTVLQRCGVSVTHVLHEANLEPAVTAALREATATAAAASAGW